MAVTALVSKQDEVHRAQRYQLLESEIASLQTQKDTGREEDERAKESKARATILEAWWRGDERLVGPRS
jgi:hypothetical protein